MNRDKLFIKLLILVLLLSGILYVCIKTSNLLNNNQIMEKVFVTINIIGVIIPFIVLSIKMNKAKVFVDLNELRNIDRFFKNSIDSKRVANNKNDYSVCNDILKALVYIFEVSFILTIAFSSHINFLYFVITFNFYLVIVICFVGLCNILIKKNYYRVFNLDVVHKFLLLYNDNYKFIIKRFPTDVKKQFIKSNYNSNNVLRLKILNAIKMKDNEEGYLYKIKTSYNSFEGFFAHTHSMLNNNSYIVISNNNKDFKHLKEINIENDDFSTFFKIYSNDENELPDFLDERLSEFLLKLYYKYSCHFELIINYNDVFIKVFYKDYLKTEDIDEKFEKYCLLSYYNSIRITEEIFNYFED